MKKIRIITGFPNIFLGFLNEGIVKLAKNRTGIEIIIYNLRDFSSDKHRKIDERPYGGGPGMILCVEPIYNAYKSFEKELLPNSKVIITDPKGVIWNQEMACKYINYDEIVIICGHYEGIDERVYKLIPHIKISIGQYILSGGEIAAMSIIDSILRLLPGCLHNSESIKFETFNSGLKADYPQYTKPRSFMNMQVPSILLSGNHKEISMWREKVNIYLGEKNDG
ncbi:MAG: tRNA (guanosine(37)-N1)-methyltransferase TrmD [Planctomycetota bacterium]